MTAESSASAKPSADASPVSPAAPQGPAVFVVDDDNHSAQMIGTIAQQEGCSVTFFSTSQEASARLFQIKPYVMFLAQRTGDDQFVRLCKVARSANVAVIVMSSSPSEANVISAFQAGAVDYLVKPFDETTTTAKVLGGLAFAKEVLNRTKGFIPKAKVEQEGDTLQEKVERLKGKTEQLFALPQATTKLIALCENPRVNASKLTEVIRVDPALSSTMIRRANSAMFRGVEKVGSLQDAVVRLGHRNVRSIATLMSVFKLSGAEAKSFAFDRFGHWIHSLGVGILAEELAMKMALAAPEDVFLAGILHDFGKLVFDDHLHHDFMKVNETIVSKRVQACDAERQMMGISHSEMGEHVARSWGLPEKMCFAIGHHHDQAVIDRTDKNGLPPVESVVALANHMTKAVLLGTSGDLCDTIISEEVWKRLQFKEDQLSAFVEEVIKSVKEFVTLLKIPSGKVPLRFVPLKDDHYVRIEDGGVTDRLLDVFYATQGFRTSRAAGPALPEGLHPKVVVYDFRSADKIPAKLDNPVPESAARHVVLKASSTVIPEYIPNSATVLPSPVDYLELWEALRK